MTSRTGTYEIEVDGHLDGHWTAWLGEVSLARRTDRSTSFHTAPIDQAQLYGLLARLRDLGVLVTMLRSTAAEVGDITSASVARTLSTERLTLRAAGPEDADATWRYRSLPEVAEWLTELPTDLNDYRDRFVDPQRLRSTVIVEHDGAVVGDFMLRVEDGWAQAEVREQAHAVQAEVGWTLDPAYSGRGFATEAARELIDHSFADLGIRRVVASCFADNRASIRLIARLGLRLEEQAVRESLHRSGRWLDTCRYAVLADEWNS